MLPTCRSATTSRSRERLRRCAALCLVAAGGGPLAAQRAAVLEWHAGLTASLARVDFVGAELGAGWRPAAGGQARVAAALAAGDAEGAVGVRVAAAAEFVLRPLARAGPSPYGGLGLAFAGAGGRRGAGYLTGLLGVEAAPGRRGGWFAELGIGGGVRLVIGARRRHGLLGPP